MVSGKTRRRKSPEFEHIVRDLKKLRQSGLIKLRELRLDSLTVAVSLIDESADRNPVYLPQAIDDLLRRAIDRMDGGPVELTCETLFGLGQGQRGLRPTELRARAANALNIGVETFRREPEQTAISELAEAILALCRDEDQRSARAAVISSVAGTRHAADSRLAVNWTERFEDYYRIWTPAYALAADLVAYRSTLLSPEREWDIPDEPGKLIAPLSAATEPYSQEYQAEGYVRFAIYRFAHFKSELQRFMVKRGGFWLLSDADSEQIVTDAVYRIGWHSPNNERDDSWMRSTYKQADGELHAFQNLMMHTSIGSEVHDDWQAWAAKCLCEWDTTDALSDEQDYFATADTGEGIDEDCPLHLVVTACNDLRKMIDADWLKIADWYRIETSPRRGVSGEELYLRYPKERV